VFSAFLGITTNSPEWRFRAAIRAVVGWKWGPYPFSDHNDFVQCDLFLIPVQGEFGPLNSAYLSLHFHCIQRELGQDYGDIP